MPIFPFLKRKRGGRIPKETNAAAQVIYSKASILPRFIRGDYTLQNSELIFSAISRISNTLSAMPINLYKNTNKVNSDLNDLLNASPNSSMTAANFIKAMEACRCTYGNCYAIKIVDENMQTVRLDILDPSCVTPYLNEETQELYYNIQPPQGAAFLIHNWYMIHVPFISTNGYTGISPISVLANTLNYAANINTFTVEQLEKGVNAAVVLEAPANLGEEQKKQMISAFLQTYKETGGNIVLLESGVQAKSLNLSPVDAKVFEVEKITRSKVAMVYNIPPHLLGDYSDSSFNTMEQQMLEFLTLTMLPIVTLYEQEFNRKLLTKNKRQRGYKFRFDVNAMLRADAATTAEVNFKAIRSAYKKPNEIRAEAGLPGDRYGDELYISKDLIPLKYLEELSKSEMKKEETENERTREENNAGRNDRREQTAGNRADGTDETAQG